MYIELLDADDAICERNWSVEEESFDYYRMYFIKGGEAFYRSADVNMPLKQWHLYIFPIHTPYSLQHNPDNPLNHLWLHFRIKPGLLNKVTELNLRSKTAINCLLDAIHYMLFDGTDSEKIKTILECLLDTMAAKHIIVYESVDKIDNAIAYIQKNLYSVITLDDIAAAANYNKSYLTKIFVKETGLTPMKYVETEKLREACRLLKNGLKICEVADLLKYSDPNNFSRSFKLYMHVSPKNYQKSNIDRISEFNTEKIRIFS